MPVTSTYVARPVFPDLGPDFSDPVVPAAFPATIERFWNAGQASGVGLGTLTADERIAGFARFEPLPANVSPPRAMRYHGHQFQVYNPELGDGRGFLFAQLQDCHGRILDLGTKGSGQTPWSRRGDGRLTLKGGVREVLAAEMNRARGVATSHAFALFETGEALMRGDEPSPTRSAVLTRLQHAHIRFGTFQRHAAEGRTDNVARLVDHVIEHYMPAHRGLDGAAAALAMFGDAMEASARLVASWMAAGFVHGVLNTDNLVMTGDSFDYGPWRFLPRFEPGFTAAYFDHQGLYAFARQPSAVSWNLARLAECLLELAPPEALSAAHGRFGALYRAALRTAVHQRLGLGCTASEADDLEFVNALFEWLGASGAGWERFFFDWFAGAASIGRAESSPQAPLYRAPAFAPLRTRILQRQPVRPERLAHPYFADPGPCDLLIEEVEALWAAIDTQDDWGPFNAKVAAIRRAGEAMDIEAVPRRAS
jgi:uncharacterized protein YdiU (UPF0061 family)